jgi:hypothetical protein
MKSLLSAIRLLIRGKDDRMLRTLAAELLCLAVMCPAGRAALTFGLTLLCLPVSLSAQPGWKVVKGRTNCCQISVPENWGQSVVMVRSGGATQESSARKRKRWS